MGEELERKRISTNPFLYTDGSLVEAEILHASLDASDGSADGSGASTISAGGGQEEGKDSDQTPQAEVPPARQVWALGRPGVVSMDLDDEKMQTMTGSYSEILERPSLPERIVEEDEKGRDENEIDDSKDEERPWSLHVGRCSPERAESALQGAGMVTRQGDIISFVANDLHNKIKLSSPVSKTVASFPGSRSSTPSLLRAALAPQVPAIDPTVINDIEAHARHIATSVDTLIENLTGTLHSISALTVDCVETYRDAVCKTCDAVDANIKSMYQLMAKTEELSKSMKPIYKLQDQIKEVRRLLDMFESAIHSSGS
ncbi:BLOC-1-related complex subunit 6-like isoform X3 [Penaeus japonicus]|uniref:BLOC-1-related complex subunit 6-like isoform X3 n=1 Tax=Penaeus japonicus TaxID=27405 RepID=UPI001C70D657|nr:BLOC-1-related complex subunit 6-like isoform X3 [Penaeus japonicus]